MALNLGGAINKRKLTNIQNISTEFGFTGTPPLRRFLLRRISN